MSADKSAAILATLKRYWGYDSFRDNQQGVIEALMSGQDAMVVMATGTGKSICYQLPAVLQRDRGVKACVLVVSPLKALMYDQVLGLQSRGILSEVLGPDTPPEVEAEIRRGQIPIVYTTPEKLNNWYDGLEAMTRNSRLLYVAIDESHCVSEWGHDFRPEYRQLHRIRSTLPQMPIIALTATATEQTRVDIETHLRLNNPATFVSSFNRPNIKYFVKNGEFSEATVIKLVSGARGSAIVYVLTQRDADDVALALRSSRWRISAASYHAGLSDLVRQERHAKFLQGTIQCVVATIAFGMGIDKPDIRLIVHYGLTKSIETYYQQTGRAGRDGLPSECVLLTSTTDVAQLRMIVGPQPTMQNRPDGIQLMQQYSLLTARSRVPCRRRYLLRHFNEALPAPPAVDCCDLCDAALNPTPERLYEADLGRDVFMLLQTIVDTGERYGISVPLLALKGSSDKRVAAARAKGYVRFWGLGRDHSDAWWKALATQCQALALISSQAMTSTRFPYDRYLVTDTGWQFLRDNTVETAAYRMSLTGDMLHRYLLENRQAREEYATTIAQAAVASAAQNVPVDPPAHVGPAAMPAVAEEQLVADAGAGLVRHLTQAARVETLEHHDLRKRLIQLRYKLATQLNRMPYDILSTSGVLALVEQLPRTVEDLTQMPGWEPTRIERFGQEFIDIIVAMNVTPIERPARSHTQPPPRRPPAPPPLMNVGRSHSEARKRSLPFQSTSSRASQQKFYKPDYGGGATSSTSAGAAEAIAGAAVSCATIDSTGTSNSSNGQPKQPNVYRPNYPPSTSSTLGHSPAKVEQAASSASDVVATSTTPHTNASFTPVKSEQSTPQPSVYRPNYPPSSSSYSPPTSNLAKVEQATCATPHTNASPKPYTPIKLEQSSNGNVYRPNYPPSTPSTLGHSPFGQSPAKVQQAASDVVATFTPPKPYTPVKLEQSTPQPSNSQSKQPNVYRPNDPPSTASSSGYSPLKFNAVKAHQHTASPKSPARMPKQETPVVSQTPQAQPAESGQQRAASGSLHKPTKHDVYQAAFEGRAIAQVPSITPQQQQQQQPSSPARYINQAYQRHCSSAAPAPQVQVKPQLQAQAEMRSLTQTQVDTQQQTQNEAHTQTATLQAESLDFDDSEHVCFQPSWSQGRDDDIPSLTCPSTAVETPPAPSPPAASQPAIPPPQPSSPCLASTTVPPHGNASPILEIVEAPTTQPPVVDLTIQRQNSQKRIFPASGLCAYPANGAKIRRRP